VLAGLGVAALVALALRGGRRERPRLR